MRKLFTLFILALAVITITAQVPQGINYQAVARNASNAVLGNQSVGVRISIIDVNPTGPVQYSETFSVTTNPFGLFNIIIGNGTLVSGSFAAITWPAGNKFIKVEIDPAGGTTYIDMGTTRFQSVPYALFAPFPPPLPSDLNGTMNYLVKNNGLNVGINSMVWDSAGMVGIGSTSPMQTLDVNGRVNVMGTIQKGGAAIGGGATNDLGLYNRQSGEWVRFSTNSGDFRFFTTDADGISSTGANAKMTIAFGGNVGIGTVSPTSILEINTSQTANVFKIHNGNLANGSLVGMEFGKANTPNNMAEFRYNHVANGSALNYVNLGLWNNANTLIVQGSGNVGIGTTAPAATLEIRNATPSIIVGDAGGTQGALYLGNSSHGVKRNYNLGNDVGLYTTAADLYLSANGTSATQFVLKNNGNIGIGISPSFFIHTRNGRGAVTQNVMIDETGATNYAGIGLRNVSGTAYGCSLYGNNANGLNVTAIPGGYTAANASAFNVISDRNVKKEIVTLGVNEYDMYLSQIRNIESATYRYNWETEASRKFPHLGFMAQSLPNTVTSVMSANPTMDDGKTMLGYNLSDMAGLTLIGIKAVDSKTQMLEELLKQQQAQIEELKKQVEALKANKK